ncbi:MAG: hypothetical protein AAGF30_05820 [Pseudomonadota bacterium]
MRRWHFYVMGLIALGYGVLVMAEYVLISYGADFGWLAFYPEDQVAWLTSLPGWVQGLLGLHAAFALVGAMCLLAHVRAAVWMLAFSFLSQVVLAIWAVFFASPTLIALAGDSGLAWLVVAMVLVLSFLIYLYARQEKRMGEVL